MFVPLPGNRSSVVWVSATQGSRAADVAQRRRIVGGRGTAVAFHSRPRPGRSRAQPVSADDRAPRRNSPATASRWSAKSAHVVPPIGAQGLNMGLRDAADIADIAGNAISLGRGSGLAGGAGALSVRPAAPTSRAGLIAIDIANRSLLSDFLPHAVAARGRHASARLVRPAAAARHARGTGAVVAQRESAASAALRKHQPAALDATTSRWSA